MTTERDYLHEYVIGDFIVPQHDIPDPIQLRNIASAALSAAHQSNTLKRGIARRTYEPVYQWVDRRVGDGNEDAAEVYRSRSGRYVTRLVLANTPAIDPETQTQRDARYEGRHIFRYRELYQERIFEDIWVGELRQYTFDWCDARTLKSQRKVTEIPSVESAEVDYVYRELLERFSDLDAEDSDLREQLQYIAGQETSRRDEFVTKDECAGLLRAMRLQRHEDDNLNAA